MSGKVLVTGAAGFIGYQVASRLLADGRPVVGVDNVNAYYDVRLKEARLARLQESKDFEFRRIDIADRGAMQALFKEGGFPHIIHLAAQAGVRHSLKDPHAYVDSNLTGFLNVLEGCRHSKIDHLIYASSSSVYGGNTKLPFSVEDRVDSPVSLYAATKRANEHMAHAYAHLFGIPSTGLRFFTVYGPWGRPDMALFIFARAILKGDPIDVYNHGDMERDFTYVDDVVESVVRLLDRPPGTTPPHALHNIGNENPVPLMRMIEVLEQALGKKAEKRMLPMQPGDVPRTHADVRALQEKVGFRPRTSIEEGVRRFVEWYLEHYQPVTEGR